MKTLNLISRNMYVAGNSKNIQLLLKHMGPSREETSFKYRDKFHSIVTSCLTIQKQLNWIESQASLWAMYGTGHNWVRSVNTFAKLINILGRWGELWKFSILPWDYRLLLQQLHASYRVSPCLKFSMVSDLRYPEMSIIQVTLKGWVFLDPVTNIS